MIWDRVIPELLGDWSKLPFVISIYTYTYTYTCIPIHTHINAYIYPYMHIYPWVHTVEYTFIYIHTLTYKSCFLYLKFSITVCPLRLPRRLNTLRSSQYGRHYTDDIFKWIFLSKNVWISIIIPLEFFFLEVQLTLFQLWLRQCLGADQATSHCLSRWWLVYWRVYANNNPS